MPLGKTDTKLASVGFVAVTFSTTALIPVAGTPPMPATDSVTTLPPVTGPWRTPVPVRVSIRRFGPKFACVAPASLSEK